MCLFISAVFPDSVDEGALRELLEGSGMSPEPLANAHVRAQLRPGERYVLLTRSHCDCGSPLFTAPRRRSDASQERDIRKKRAKGWSEARIEKWLASRGPSPSARPRREGLFGREDWKAFMSEALALPGARYVALLGHWYAGDLAGERIEITARRDCPLDALDGSDGSEERVLELDVLHVFAASEPRR